MQSYNKYEQTDRIATDQYESAYKDLRQKLYIRRQTGELMTNHDMYRMSELANYIAMNSLKDSNFLKAYRYLKRADKYSKHNKHMLLVTLNNWSCYYKKIKDNNMALDYINRAIKVARNIEQNTINNHNIELYADCYLNLCAILSNVGEHEAALHNAQKAIQYLEQGMHEFVKNHQDEPQKITDRRNVMAIAKYNMAAELEYLKKFDEALKEYKALRHFLGYMFNGMHPLAGPVNKAIREMTMRSKIYLKIHERNENRTESRHYMSIGNEERLPNVLRYHNRASRLSSMKSDCSKTAVDWLFKKRQSDVTIRKGKPLLLNLH